MHDGLARGLAIAGLAVAVLSLGWQVYTWRRNTGRIKVSLNKQTHDTYGGQRDTAEVTVRNVGSGPVYVETISFVLSSAVPVVWEPDDKTSPVLPYSVAAGEARSWRFLLGHHGANPEPLTLPMRAIVRLGDGRQRWSSTNPPVFRIGQ